MNEPPDTIDGAKVLEWAWSGQRPFGLMGDTEFFGLVIATYDHIEFYRFSCDLNWETANDGLYDSIYEAKEQLPDQYKQVPAKWLSKG